MRPRARAPGDTAQGFYYSAGEAVTSAAQQENQSPADGDRALPDSQQQYQGPWTNPLQFFKITQASRILEQSKKQSHNKTHILLPTPETREYQFVLNFSF